MSPRATVTNGGVTSADGCAEPSSLAGSTRKNANHIKEIAINPQTRMRIAGNT
ncbi:MAG: hypothetical protein M3R66_13435 [Actinomycetota bacterium]|nr:hypothetical protein [Actinomycetota bacterium]